jgi:hypothetical protein
MGVNDEQRNFSDDFKTIGWLWKELIILLLAIFIGISSYKFNSIFDGSGDTTGLFGRSGSLLVLLAMINEYRLRTLRDRQLSYFESKEMMMHPDKIRKLFRPKLFWGQQILTFFTHVLVIIGTIIWGFGDLFIKIAP